ncbi:MAG TPA: Arc family DNA-binding protein [Pseudolabrys sp.]|nr:Arc family DNA-binding protein [Pseudolabrys sp.]
MAADAEVRITFRMPANLRERVAAAAEKNNRSMNAEIVARLEASFFDDALVEGADRQLMFVSRAIERLKTFIDEKISDEEFIRSLIVGAPDAGKRTNVRSLANQAGSSTLTHIIELRALYGLIRKKVLPTKILLKALEGYLVAVKHLVEIMEDQVGGKNVADLKREFEMTETLLKSVWNIYR